MDTDAARLRNLVEAGRWDEAALLVAGNAAWEQAAPAPVTIAAWKTYRALGEAAEAETWLDRALAQAPDNAALQRAKGNCHKERSEWARAAACYARAAALQPEQAVFHAAHAHALEQGGDLPAAAAAVARALALDESKRSWWLLRARLALRLEDRPDAAAAYARALALDREAGSEDTALRAAHEELGRQIASGARAASSHYYDAVYAQSGKYAGHGTDSVYQPAWERIAAWLRAGGARRILDLGCGPGQFAEFLGSRLPDADYTGIDFSPVAVGQARERCPRYRFEQATLPLQDFSGLPAFDAVVCTEVLEHVEPDREILEPLPAGVLLAASVPSFFSFSHLRLFDSAAAVRARYGALFDRLAVEAVPLAPGRCLWLLLGRRAATREEAR